jgi:hypothetical protein
VLISAWILPRLLDRSKAFDPSKGFSALDTLTMIFCGVVLFYIFSSGLVTFFPLLASVSKGFLALAYLLASVFKF